MPTDDAVASARDKYLRRAYGIGSDDYDAILADQDGRCWICRRRPRSRPLVVDHNHKRRGRQSVRGLLCGSHSSSCNRVLGMLRDDPALIRRMAEYLETEPAQAVLAARESAP